MLSRVFYCAEDGCVSAESFTLHEVENEFSDMTFRLLAMGCGWVIDGPEAESWCPSHKVGQLSGV